MLTSIQERFAKLNLHDCVIKNASLSFGANGIVDSVIIVEALPDEYIPALPIENVDKCSVTRCEIRFMECVGFHFDNNGMDILCIDDTQVFTESPLLADFIVKHDKALPEYAGKEKYYHFSFRMYPAVIDIIAKDFEIVIP